MILDQNAILAVPRPASGQLFGTPLDVIDLLDGHSGVPPLVGDGNRVFVQIEVTEAFASTTSATAHYHVALSDLATPDTSVHTTTVASVCGGFQTPNGLFSFALSAQDLQLGAIFNVEISPWARGKNRDLLNPPAAGLGSDALRLMRYLTVFMTMPNFFQTTPTPVFTTGASEARLVLDPDSFGGDITSRLYPAGMKVQ